MEKQELIQITKDIMRKNFCNGISINDELISETSKEVRFHLDYWIPKKVQENDVEYTFFIQLKNVGIITLSKNGELINKTNTQEFIKETVEKYKELLSKREKLIIRIFADRLIKVHLIHIALTPLRKVLRKFIDSEYRIDNLNKNFEYKEINYIHFLKSFGYLRKEGDVLTLDNEYIKKLERKIKDKEEKIEKITSDIFAEHFRYIIQEFNIHHIVPFIGILTTLCNLFLELNKKINISIKGLYGFYRESYLSSQDENDFLDKIIDMNKLNILTYDDTKRAITLPNKSFEELVSQYKLTFTQKQIF